MSKSCDKFECKANDGQGFCLINTCSLIDPERAIEEFKLLKEGGSFLNES